jgi:DNA-binding response OmpR family regulator
MKKIALIEDDRTMQALLKTLLEIEGYIVIQSEAGDEEGILKSLADSHPDILLLDVHLHNLNGISLLKGIRSDKRLNHLKIIMTSGMDLKDECKRNGADGFLQKPYMPEELIKILQASLKI